MQEIHNTLDGYKMKNLKFLLAIFLVIFSVQAFAQMEVRDGASNQKYINAAGSGTSSDPYNPVHIDFPHKKVHEGNFYTLSHIFSTVANNSSAEIIMQLGSTYQNHSVFDASAGGDAEFYIFESPTLNSSGSSLSAINNNRASANTADASYFYTPNVSDAGTQLYGTFIAGGGFFGAGGSDGGPVRAGTEMILKTDTTYLIRVVNTSGGAQDISIAVGFYEN